jgi:predicted MFS family arabinose efflux permease
MFYLSMGISKYTQILYFQQNGKLINFSLAYSAMAIAGSFSFLIANRLEGMSLRKVAKILGLIYATGMILRVFFQSSWIAIISGSISGFGAAILILVVRKWIYAESDKNPEDKQILISSRYTIMQITSLLATLVTGLILFIFSSSNVVYIVILAATAMAIILLPANSVPADGEIKIEKKSKVFALPVNRVRGLSYLVAVIFMGITTSIVDPIAPALLRATGYNVGAVSVIITSLGVVTMLSAFLFQLPIFNKQPARYFWLVELFSGSIIIFCGLMTRNQYIWIMIAFIVMSVEGTGFFILKELVEYDMFPKEETVVYLGLAQSGFLIGDAIGAPVGTFLFQFVSGRILLILYGVMAMICGFSYMELSKVFERDKLRV